MTANSPPPPARLRRPLDRRPNPCAEIELPEDAREREKKRPKSTLETHKHFRSTRHRNCGAAAWQRVQRAYLDGRLRAGQVISCGGLHKICGAFLTDMLQLDLAIHRVPCRLVEPGRGLQVLPR
jgi:hypothetical protein